MKYSEKRAMLLKDSRKAFDHGLYVQQVGRFKRRPSMFCGLNPTRSTNRLREAFISLGKSGQAGANSGTKFLMCWYLATIKANLRRTLLYQLPKSTISDHLKDCFGFLRYKRHDRFDEFVDAFHKALLKEMPWLKGMGV